MSQSNNVEIKTCDSVVSSGIMPVAFLVAALKPDIEELKKSLHPINKDVLKAAVNRS